MKWALVGVGHIGSAILEGWIRAGHKAEDGLIKEYTRAQEEALQKKYGTSPLLDPSQLAECELILFAVKPQDMPEAIAELAPHLGEKTVLVSIAAGINLSSLRRMLADSRTESEASSIIQYPIIRALPNLPAKVGEGISAIVANEYVTLDQLRQAKAVFQNLGLVVELPEENFAAVTALSGSGPAFVAIFIEALADAAVYVGLHRDTAYLLATQTLLGTAKLLLESKIPPSILKDQVSTAAGTSIYGLRALEKNGFRTSVYDAIVAASDRTKELASESGIRD